MFPRIFSYAKGKYCFFLLGIFFSIANGLIFPIFSIFFGKMLTALITINSPYVTEYMKIK